MAGTIWTYQRCPGCGESYPSSKGGFPIICEKCKTQPTKFLIKIYWDGKGHLISRDRDGKTIHHWQHAVNLLGGIRSEIQAGTFDIEIYRKQSSTRFNAFWDNFLNNYRDNIGTYDKLISIKNNHLDELSKYHMRDIRALHIDQWWKGLRAKELSPHYLNDILSWVKRFFTEAQALDIIEKVPRFPGALTQPETVPEWLTQTEQNQIFAYIPKYDRPIFDFMFLTGVRVNEATALQR